MYIAVYQPFITIPVTCVVVDVMLPHPHTKKRPGRRGGTGRVGTSLYRISNVVVRWVCVLPQIRSSQISPRGIDVKYVCAFLS